MTTPAIIERVRDLQQQLAEAPDAPVALVAEVESVRKALDTILIDPTDAALYKSLRDRLLAAYIGFETANPRIAGAMQGLITALSTAGI